MGPADPPFGRDEPVPEDVLRAARDAFARRFGGDVASIVYDSLVDEHHPPEDHVLRFEHERFSFEVRVSVTPPDVVLDGTVSPATPGRFELRMEPTDLSFVYASRDGSFSFGPVGHGLVRISFEPAGAAEVQTDWFRV